MIINNNNNDDDDDDDDDDNNRFIAEYPKNRGSPSTILG